MFKENCSAVSTPPVALCQGTLVVVHPRRKSHILCLSHGRCVVSRWDGGFICVLVRSVLTRGTCACLGHLLVRALVCLFLVASALPPHGRGVLISGSRGLRWSAAAYSFGAGPACGPISYNTPYALHEGCGSPGLARVFWRPKPCVVHKRLRRRCSRRCELRLDWRLNLPRNEVSGLPAQTTFT